MNSKPVVLKRHEISSFSRYNEFYVIRRLKNELKKELAGQILRLLRKFSQQPFFKKKSMISHDLIPPGGRFPWGLSSTNSDCADPIGVAAFRSSINLEHPSFPI
ncbi:hypothetical protein [Evansella halocellulosilytica]|uniref:hypothetical protein n=1 Tax=Evansella halocellulosilytica TaxID=2011013 RepID=UPI0011557444|nr:hypothetical protein [Evansella halocellulosilytica]